MLSCFKDDADILKFLQQRRASFKPVSNEPKPAGVAPDYSFARVISVGLALVELGDKDALDRIQQVFARHDKDKLDYLLGHLKFVENKTVLRECVELLKDKQRLYTMPDPPPGSDYMVSNKRICDLVAESLCHKAGWRVNIFTWELLPDEDLEKVRKSFTDQFALAP